jgi:hypothetical protein
MRSERRHEVPSTDSPQAVWRMSTHSGGTGECVQVTVIEDDPR